MKNTLILILSLMLYCNLHAAEIYSKKMADSQMSRSGTISTWDYPNGLFIESILKIYDKYGDEKYYNYALNHAKATIESNGKIKSKYNFTAYNLDYVNPGMFLLGIYEKEKNNDHRYKIALDTLRKQLTLQPRNSLGGFWHKKIYPDQMWLDGIFMGSRYYAAYEVLFSQGENLDTSLDDVINQFSIIHAKTYNSEKKLNYHAWAEDPTHKDAFWAKKENPFSGCSHEFWARGNGWYFAALVDVLEVIPDAHPRYEELCAIAQEVAEGIKYWQDENSGLWFQLLEYDENTCTKGKCNYLEASASCMYTYALLKAVRLGILSKEEYLPAAKKAYQGILTHLISEKGGIISLNDICQSAGLGPASSSSRDGSIEYYLTGSDAGNRVSNDLKGVGPFIMASVEFEMLPDEGNSSSAIQLPNTYSFHYSQDSHTGNISINDHSLLTVEIFNILGKKVYETSGYSSIYFSLNNYSQGNYMIKINNQETKKVMKF